MQPHDHKTMRLNSDLVLRKVKDDYLIINPFSETVDMTQVFTLNETAAWLWQQMEGKEFEAEDLARAMLDEYDVDEPTAANAPTTLPNNGLPQAWQQNRRCKKIFGRYFSNCFSKDCGERCRKTTSRDSHLRSGMRYIASRANKQSKASSTTA